MADLHDDFLLLILKSCDGGLKDCHALSDLPQLAPLLAGLTPFERTRFLKAFLLNSVHHAIERAIVVEERNVIRAAAAFIGLEPRSSGTQDYRAEVAAKILETRKSARTMRSDPWREKFATKLAEAVYDFLDDPEAVRKFVDDTQRSLASSTPTTNKQSPSDVAHLSYTHRPKLEGRFQELCDSGAKIIVLHGVPGMGKTWLARELAFQLHPDHIEAPIFRVSNGKVDVIEPHGAFDAAGIPLQAPVTGDPTQYIAMLVYSNHAPLFTIIDGLESADELRRLLPSNLPRNIVIATCRDRGKSPPEQYRFLKVAQMEPNEAISMIRHDLPSASNGEAELLAGTLSSYPLVMGYACSFLADQNIPIAQFCDDLHMDLARVAGKVATGDTSTLLFVLRRIVDVIRESDYLAFELLAAMASATVVPVLDRNMLVRYVTIFSQREPVSQTQFGEAMAVLKRFSLYDSVAYPYGGQKSAIIMHRLTQRLLKVQLANRQAALIALRFTAMSMAFAFPKSWSPEEMRAPIGGQDSGDFSVEAATIIAITVDLCGELIIEDRPSGGYSNIPPEHRALMEKFLAVSIVRMEGLFQQVSWPSDAESIHVPRQWLEWAIAYRSQSASTE